MIIISHQLFLRHKTGEIKIWIHIRKPVPEKKSWKCEYEISWPEGKEVSAAFGIDALQAMVLALQMIGSDIYSSSYHKSGKLRAYDSIKGYGFPLPHVIRDLAVGIDANPFG